jgi:hypothetical protein
MAASVTKSRDNSGEPGSSERDLLVKFNVLVGAIDVLCTKLDAMRASPTPTTQALVGNLNSKIGDMSGTAITT